jgi:hypothetical protein
MEDPELITLIPEEEEEQLPPPPPELGRKLVIQLVTVVVLKVATGIAIKNLVKTIREFDVLYPEHLDRINWKDQS